MSMGRGYRLNCVILHKNLREDLENFWVCIGILLLAKAPVRLSDLIAFLSHKQVSTCGSLASGTHTLNPKPPKTQKGHFPFCFPLSLYKPSIL